MRHNSQSENNSLITNYSLAMFTIGEYISPCRGNPARRVQGTIAMSYSTSVFRSPSAFGQNSALEDGQLARLAPSIFATQAHESRSAKYAYIPTSAVLEGMRKEGFVPVRANQGKSRIEGKAEFTKHMIRFRHSSFIGTETLGQIVPEIVLINSHDGTSAYHLMAGLFRIACLNGMIRCESKTADVRVPHKGNVVDNVIEGAFTVIEDSKGAIEQATAWGALRLTSDERSIMADAARVIRFGDSDGNVETAITAGQLLRPRRIADRDETLWTTHNVIQENVIRGGLHAWTRDANGRQRQTTTREVRNIDGDVKLNRALWMLSTRMAELKGAS